MNVRVNWAATFLSMLLAGFEKIVFLHEYNANPSQLDSQCKKKIKI